MSGDAISTDHPAMTVTGTPSQAPAPHPPFVRRLAVDRLSGVYAWAFLIAVFACWVPGTFLTVSTARSIGANSAVTLLAALALIVPLACGLYDLSVAATLGLTSVIALHLQNDGLTPLLAIGMCLIAGTVIGAVNAVLVVRMGVSSFIATLGMSSVLAGAAYWITNGVQVVGNATGVFVQVGQSDPLGIPFPVWASLAVVIVLGYVTELTTLGRYLYAIGGNTEAARLAGIRVNRIQAGSLVTSGVLAALAGVVLAAQLGATSADIGPAYLLPAFSAVLLGATQVKSNGRANVGGTVVAVVLLSTGIYGLQLVGAASYISDLFNGAALIVAVSLSVRAGRA